MPSNRPRRLVAPLLVASVAAVSLASPALAGEDDVVRRGACSGATDWKLKVGPENGRLEVEGEIDSNRGGQTWTWRIVHDGSLVDRGTGTTGGRSGSFEVRRVVRDAAGTDHLVLRARNAATGETCRGTLAF